MNVTFEYGTDTTALPKAILYLLSLPPCDVPASAPTVEAAQVVEAAEPAPAPAVKPTRKSRKAAQTESGSA